MGQAGVQPAAPALVQRLPHLALREALLRGHVGGGAGDQPVLLPRGLLLQAAEAGVEADRRRQLGGVAGGRQGDARGAVQRRISATGKLDRRKTTRVNGSIDRRQRLFNN